MVQPNVRIYERQWYAETTGTIIIGVETVVDTGRFSIAVSVDVVGDKQLIFCIDIFRMDDRRIEEGRMAQDVVRDGVQDPAISEGAGDAVAGRYIDMGALIAGYTEFGAEEHIFVANFCHIDTVGGAGGDRGSLCKRRVPGSAIPI